MDKLRKICEEYLEFLGGDEYHEDHDYAELVFEEALEAVFGEGIWDRIHKLVDAQESRQALT